MNKVVFSSLGGKIVDNRGLAPDRYILAENLELPLEYKGRKLRAFMAMQGLVIDDAEVNVVGMTHTYLNEVYKISCGDCSVGYLGTKIMLEILGKFETGAATENDINSLQRIGSGMVGNTRCDFCGLAVKPVLDTLKYFRDDYTRLIGSKRKVSETIYLTRVTSPCMEACPAHQDIPGYIELTENRRYEEALRLIRETNCFPGAIGRACVAFCEANCTRNDIDEPLAIRALKRFPADYETKAGLEPKLGKKREKKPKVAVIGAGPAGLAASYNLAIMGYQVTVYDDQSYPGGMALTGIPAYRLPKDILKREIDIIKGLGIEIKPQIKLGRDITLEQLFEQDYRAVFIGTGAHQSRISDIENWEANNKGMINGIEFLRDINLGAKVTPGQRVIIVGGGNVAVDCARTCLRLGASEVRIVYRRSRAEMPASKDEIDAAQLEGTRIEFLATPVKILTEKGKVTGVEITRMSLGEPDASGRRRPIPIENSEYVIPADWVISAIGESPDLSFIGTIHKTKQGTVAVELPSYRTSRSDAFAGGDCVTGPASLIEAVASGNRAAKSIDQYLRSGDVTMTRRDIFEEWSHNIGLNRSRNGGKVRKSPRLLPEQVAVPERILNFAEVEHCFTADTAIKEASRCLRCYRVMVMAVASKG